MFQGSWILSHATSLVALLILLSGCSSTPRSEQGADGQPTSSDGAVQDAAWQDGASADTAPPSDSGPPPDIPVGNVLTVNAAKPIRPFDRRIKGIALANWTFSKAWAKPFVGEIQGLPQAIGAIDPGLVRYAGGLWANWVGFDRTLTQITPQTAWTYNGKTYYYNYGTDELASVDAFAKSIQADVMIQVNISNDDPAMWADLVKFAKEEGYTSFRYYELGNEIDLETFTGSSVAIDSTTYASRVVAYQQAMLAQDSTIEIVAGVPAAATDVFRTGYSGGGNTVSEYITKTLPAIDAAGLQLAAASYHWYQTDGSSSSIADVMQWSFGIPTSSPDFWKASYSRQWSELVPGFVHDGAQLSSYPGTQQGISELGVNSGDGKPTNGNHAGALWYSDVLGRLAYHGVSWITQWDSYASEGEYFSLLYPDNDQTTTPTIHARPTYYAYLMYSQYFGDQLVESATYDPKSLSIWASTDSGDPGTLKLRITNLSAADITVPVVIAGFAPAGGDAYVLASTDPTSTSEQSATSQAPTTINGVTIDAMNVASSLQGIQPQTVTVSGHHFTFTFPAYSSVAIVLHD